MLQVFRTVQLLIQAYTEDPPSDAHYLELTEAEVVTYLKQGGSAVVLRRDAKDVPTILWEDPEGVWSRSLDEDASVAKYGKGNVRHAVKDVVNAPHPDTVV